MGRLRLVDIVWHTYEQDGAYLVTVDAVGPDGLLAYSLTEESGPWRQPPLRTDRAAPSTIVFASELEYGETTATLRATAQTSTLTQGETVNFAWAFADGSTDTGETVTHLLEGISPYLVNVTAHTSAGRSAETFKYFSLPGTVGPVPPDEEEPDELEDEKTELAADAGPDQTVEGGSLVTLNGSGSSIPTDARTTIRWRQIGGTSVALAAPDSLVTRVFGPTTPIGFSKPCTSNSNSSNSKRSASDQVAVTVIAGRRAGVTDPLRPQLRLPAGLEQAGRD